MIKVKTENGCSVFHSSAMWCDFEQLSILYLFGLNLRGLKKQKPKHRVEKKNAANTVVLMLIIYNCYCCMYVIQNIETSQLCLVSVIQSKYKWRS